MYETHAELYQCPPKYRILKETGHESGVSCPVSNVFSCFCVFCVFPPQYEYKFIQEKTHQDWGISWVHQASAQNCLCTNLKPEAGYQRTSACSIEQDWLALDEPVRHVKSPELLVGCLMLSAGQDSIFDWLASGNSELRVTTGYILTWVEVNNESGVCCVFFLWYSSFLLAWKGISGEASIALQISLNVWNLWLRCAKHSHTGDQF